MKIHTKTFKDIVKNIFLLGLSLFLFLAVLELVLRTGYFDDMDNPHPIWIPYKYKKINDEINIKRDAILLKFIENNSGYGFKKKKEGIYRILVLGDSFIVGDGVPLEGVWSYKFKKKMTKYSDKIEIYCFGGCGWATLKEFQFIEEWAPFYNMDLLIVDFVVNDPDMGDYKMKYFSLHNKKLMRPLRALLPNAVDFIGEYLDSAISRFSSDYGHDNWIKKLYSQQNLEKYQQLLIAFSKFCRSNNIRLLFVFTPNNYESYFRARFDQIIPLLKNAGIEYLDLYPAVLQGLNKYKLRELWGNPANAHPGEQVTELFAKEVMRYLIENKFTKKPEESIH